MYAKDNNYDIIFMDIVMPVMNGYAFVFVGLFVLIFHFCSWDACKQIRASGYSKSIVITTANQVTGEAAVEIAAAGANEAISKPFSKEHIIALLQKFGANNALKV